MVDDHHAMNDVDALDFDAVWELLKSGVKLSAMKGGAHLFSFWLRPAAAVTPATVKVLVDSRYLDAGWLRRDATRLEPLPDRTRFKQAPRDGDERRQVYRLFDEFLLQGGVPAAIDIVERELFDVANARAYAAAKPDLYREASSMGNGNDYLKRIRNCASLSPKQEAFLRGRIAKRANKGTPALVNGNANPSRAEQDRARAQHQQEQDIARNERRKWRDLNGEDYEDEYNE